MSKNMEKHFCGGEFIVNQCIFSRKACNGLAQLACSVHLLIRLIFCAVQVGHCVEFRDWS